MVAIIENNVAAGEKCLGSVISTLRESLRNPNDLQAGNLENPTATALASFLVTVIRTDGDHLSQDDINAYLESLCQNANTSFEDQLIRKAAQIALKTLNEENSATLSPAAIANEVARIAHGTENAANNIMRFNLAAIQAQQQVTL